MIDGPALFASLLTGAAVAAAAALTVKPTRRLAPRLRPYTIVSRTSLGRSADVLSVASPGGILGSGNFRRLFGPIVQSMAWRLGRIVDATSEEHMLLRLRQAGMLSDVPEEQRLAEYRIRQFTTTVATTIAGAVAGLVVGRSTAMVLAMAALAFVMAVGRQKGRIEREIEDRRNRMRIEIYTINQLLAMKVRVGGGVIQATQQLVERGNGAVVDEMAEALRMHRNGLPAAQAFDRAARLTPEPHCSRTYSLIAAAEERGSDLADGLLALSEDVRESRREALKRSATKRRAAMLIPTIAVLAPIMLLFVGAPLPWIIFQWQ